MAFAIDLADWRTDPDAIVAALETIDVELARGRFSFYRGSHRGVVH